MATPGLKIVLDLQACQSPEGRRRGIGRYSLALAKAMAANPRGHRISLLLNAAMAESIESLRSQFDGLVATQDIVLWRGMAPTALMDPANAFRQRASELLRRDALRALRPDVVHVASFFDGIGDDAVCTISRQEPFLTAVTLYDLIPLAHPQTYLADTRTRHWYLDKAEQLKQAHQLLGISRFTCNEAEHLLSIPGERLSDISAAADAIFVRLPEAESFRVELMARYHIRRPFVMYAGGFDPRKNIPALMRAFAKLPSTLRRAYQLLIVGGIQPPERSAHEKHAFAAGLSADEVVFAGYVPDADLVKLYNLCALHVLPSLQEGFGLPALEAMSSGAVVIGSNTSSLPEVIGMDAALFDPRDDAAIARCMAMGLADEEFRQRFRTHAEAQSRKFSWSESARRALDALELAHARDAHGRSEPASKTLPGTRAARRIELTDDAAGAEALRQARNEALDIATDSLRMGHALSALAVSDRALLVELTYRAAGYDGVRAAIASRFDADVLGEWVPPSAVDALGDSQWLAPASAGSHVVPWRDRVEAFAAELGADPAARDAGAHDWANLAASLSANIARVDPRTHWFVDISQLAAHDAGTGIQRVVRHVLDELMASPPAGCRVEPVYLDADGVIRHARDYCSRRYFDSEKLPDDDAVEVRNGDVFLGLDLAAHLVPAHQAAFQRLRDLGATLNFVVYDLLPLLRPDCFDPHGLPAFRAWYETVARVGDGVLCISRAVAEEFESWLDQLRPQRERPLAIGWFHLGADIAVASTTDAGEMRHAPDLQALGDRPTFLMVGTIEPRKGHAQALSAFEALWDSGLEVNLLIIGKPGWLVDGLVARLREHSLQGTRLFWYEKAGDDVLLAAYRRASALLAPSEGEGFGLPLIEAAHHGLPLIVRDMPVFREIAGEHALYFSGHDAESLAAAVRHWLQLRMQGAVPASSAMTWSTWREATRQMVDVIRHDHWQHRWQAGDVRVFHAFDYRFNTQVGTLARGRMQATSQSGLLFYGPYIALPTGAWMVELFGSGLGTGHLDVCSGHGALVHARLDFGLEAAVPVGSTDAPLLRMAFVLRRDVADLEIRLAVDAQTEFQFDRVVVRPQLSHRDSFAQSGAEKSQSVR